MTNDMTNGSPIKLILSFMVPLLIGNIFQQFYNMADTIIVGRTISVEALAAVGAQHIIASPQTTGVFVNNFLFIILPSSKKTTIRLYHKITIKTRKIFGFL